MSDAAVTTGLQSNIGRLTQEAVNLARRFGFGQLSQTSAARPVPDKPQPYDLLNCGALYCWCDPD